MKDIGHRIEELRKHLRLSQEEFGDKIGVARQTISKWELGDNTPTIKNLQKICDMFKIDINFFVGSEPFNESVCTVSEAQSNLKSTKPIKFKVILITAILLILISLSGVAYALYKQFLTVNREPEDEIVSVVGMSSIDFIFIAVIIFWVLILIGFVIGLIIHKNKRGNKNDKS